MYIDFLTLVVPFLLLAVFGLQLLATYRVHKNVSFEPDQRRAQMWFIWLVPILGAAVVLSVLIGEPREQVGKKDRHAQIDKRA